VLSVLVFCIDAVVDPDPAARAVPPVTTIRKQAPVINAKILLLISFTFYFQYVLGVVCPLYGATYN
jgi:hypothetical protein